MSISRRKFLQRSAYTASACAAVSALTGCGLFADAPQPNAASTPEATDTPKPPVNPSDKKTLYIYGWANYVTIPEVFAGFTKETGFKVVGDTYDSNEVMLAKLQAAGGKSGYSIIYPSDYMVSQMHDLDLLVPLDKKAIANLSNLAPEYLNLPYDPGNKYSLPVSLGSTGIAYNVKAVQSILGDEGGPADWSYLWQHKQKLRISLLNDYREVMGMALHSLGYSYNSKDPHQLQQAFIRLRDLTPAIAKFTTDAWRDFLVAGDLMLCMAFSSDGISLARQDPNIKYVLPASGTSIWGDTVAIPKGAPNLEAAYAWIDYTLKPEVAAQFSNANSLGTPNRFAKSKIADDLKGIAAWEPNAAVMQKSDRISKLEPDVLQIYETYWTRLTTGLG